MSEDEMPEAGSDGEPTGRAGAEVPQTPTRPGESAEVAERHDEEGEHHGERETPPKRTSRHERYKRAIERLRHENMQLREGDAPSQQTGDVPKEQARRIRQEAAFEMRAQEYFRENPKAREEIGAVLSTHQPAEHVTDVILQSEIGPALVHELSRYPDAVLDLNQSSPAEAARVLGIVEGRLRTQLAMAARQDSVPQRRMTSAPAPLTMVRGGGSPTPDLSELAKRDDVSAYAAARRRQQEDDSRR